MHQLNSVPPGQVHVAVRNARGVVAVGQTESRVVPVRKPCRSFRGARSEHVTIGLPIGQLRIPVRPPNAHWAFAILGEPPPPGASRLQLQRLGA